MVRIILHTIIMYMIRAWYIQVKISTVWSKNTYKSNYVADCSIFSIRGHCIIDQIRWLSSVNGEIGKHLNFVLVVDFIFNPSLGVMPLSLERPDLKELIKHFDLRRKNILCKILGNCNLPVVHARNKGIDFPSNLVSLRRPNDS